MSYKRLMIALVAGVLSLGLVAAPAFATGKPAATAHRAHKAHVAKTFNARAAMIAAANTYFKNSPSPIVSATDLYKSVLAKDGVYQIVDVRQADAYALGHIEGAINIPFSSAIVDDANLAKLDSSKTVVTVCYTGETASMTNMVWSMLGYKTTTLMYGMTGWVTDKDIVGIDIPTGIAAGYPTSTKATTSRRTYRAPKLKGNYANVAAAIKGQTRRYFAEGLAPIMTAAQVRDVSLKKHSRYQIVSVAQKADYATGHIKGATNIVWTDIADQMKKLDPKKTTIVYCYTGNTGAQASMFLNIMGYKTFNMMSGMASWNNDPTVGGFSGYNPANVISYPTVK